MIYIKILKCSNNHFQYVVLMQKRKEDGNKKTRMQSENKNCVECDLQATVIAGELKTWSIRVLDNYIIQHGLKRGLLMKKKAGR